jgi:hypothetical protein
MYRLIELTVEDPIQNTLLRSELDGHAARITSQICRTSWTSYGRESHGDGGTSSLLEDVRRQELRGVICGGLEVAMGASAASMDNSATNQHFTPSNIRNLVLTVLGYVHG